MSMHYVPENLMPTVAERSLASEDARNSLLPMGETSERVSERFGVSRHDQDAFAAESHRRAHHAQSHGWFKSEIEPVPIPSENGDNSGTMCSEDDGIRANASVEGLSKLRPVFRDNGSTTAGNASQVSDGAAAVLLMTRQRAMELGVPILGKFVQFAVVGVPPDVMGIGPAYAIPHVLAKANFAKDAVDVYEINEAFASQAVYCMRQLKLDPAKVNPVGGAIAFGHPLGATGARQVATVLAHMQRNKLRVAITSMCIGTGMGAASIIENEQL